MTAIDVGQGDSIFLAFPDGKTMLVDAGGIPQFKHRESANTVPVRMEIGEDVVAPYLWTRSIREIDVLAISHLHDDHAGGVPAILNDFRVGELWVGATPPCDIWNRIQAKAKERGTVIRRVKRGDAWPFGGTQLTVLEPASDYVPGAAPGNNDSVVMRIVYGATFHPAHRRHGKAHRMGVRIRPGLATRGHPQGRASRQQNFFNARIS